MGGRGGPGETMSRGKRPPLSWRGPCARSAPACGAAGARPLRPWRGPGGMAEVFMREEPSFLLEANVSSDGELVVNPGGPTQTARETQLSQQRAVGEAAAGGPHT